RDKKKEYLEKAWDVTQAILAAADIKSRDKADALKRAVELAPKIKEELGEVWLAESFTKRANRGKEILAVIGAEVATGLQKHPQDVDFRLKSLKLQATAVEALLKAAPETAKQWRDTVSLLAGNWLTEAEFSHLHDHSAGLGPRLRRDPFGNLY